MTSSRLARLAAIGIAVVLVVQALVTLLVSYVPVGVSIRFPADYLPGLISGIIFDELLPVVAFAVGIWICLRFVSRVEVSDCWSIVIRKGVQAALLGAAAYLVYLGLQAVVLDFTVSKYPFVNAVDPSVNGAALAPQLLSSLLSTVRELVEWVPLAVLAVVLVRIRLAMGVEPDENATDRASDAESLSAR